MKKAKAILFCLFVVVLFVNFTNNCLISQTSALTNYTNNFFGLPILINNDPIYGYPDETILWDRINDAFLLDPDLNLRYNHSHYKLAILDTGLEEPTWSYLASKYLYYVLEIKLIDADGNYVSRSNVYDICDYKHGSILTSLSVELLERNADQFEEYVYGSIYMFICAPNNEIGASGGLDETIIEPQLQWIINFNNLYPTAPFKVLSLSFGKDYDGYPIYYDELHTLINQGCIIVAASRNYRSDYIAENKRISPATFSNIIGVGGIYGFPATGDLDNSRMSFFEWNPDPDDPNVHKDGSLFYSSGGMSQSTVFVTAPGYYVKGICDIDDDGYVEAIKATGTSLSTPQVAIAAYLSFRISYLTRGIPISLAEFKECLKLSAENYDLAINLPQEIREKLERVGIPESNAHEYNVIIYSYRVGYGSLDIGDLFEFVLNLS